MPVKIHLHYPYTCLWQPAENDIDHYGHVNNTSYVKQLEVTAWAHSNHLGLDIAQYRELDAGMVIAHHTIDYLLPVHCGETIECRTAIIACDNKLRLSRGFEFYNQSQQRVLTARTDFVCITLSTGKPRRMPARFAECYGRAYALEVGA
ncbi:MAG: acyl-CoA thioesterase [Alteromonadaceae bacterium]|nr:acyl-CoA thioesterase [Alteromonadaceae bacterium]